MTEIEIKKNVNSGDKMDAPCSSCKTSTKHMILLDVDLSGREFTEDYFIYGWDDSYKIIQCLGCENVSFSKTHQSSEEEIHWEGPDGYQSSWRVFEEFYPNPEEGRECIPDKNLLPRNLQLIYTESLSALNSNLSVLCGIGIRAIVETVCKEKEAEGSNLEKKIDNLVSQGVLTRDGAKILHKVRTLGNEAAHEVKPHGSVQLGLAFDVVEHLLKGVYILPEHAKAKFK